MERLRKTLRTVRQASQALVRETHPGSLIRQVCASLCESGAYEQAWIALLDSNGRAYSVGTSAGFDGRFAALFDDLLTGRLPRCAQETLTEQDIVRTVETLASCGDCPLADLLPGQVRLSTTIAFGGSVYGILSAALPKDVDGDIDEQSVFAGLAENVAFAIQKMEHLEKLDEIHTQYRNIFGNSHIPMLLIDMDTGLIENANPAAIRYYGWSSHELIGKPITEINTQTLANIQEQLASVGHEEEHSSFQFQHRLADGSIRDVEVHSGPIRSGSKQLLFSIVNDVTEQVKEKKKNKKIRRDLEQAQIIGRLGHFEYDIETDIWTNSSVLDTIFGIDESFNRTAEGWLKIVHEDDRAFMQNYLLEYILRNRNDFDHIYRIRRLNDGQMCWVHGRAELICVSDRPVHLVGTIQDVTDMVTAQDDLLTAKNAAEAANRSKSEFLANVSHELRTPLNAIIGFSEIMASEQFGPHSVDKYKEYSEYIHQSGQDIVRLVGDIFDISRVEMGTLDVNEEWTTVSEHFLFIMQFFQIRAQSKNITLTSQENPFNITLFVDPQRFRQIIVNLLNNAIKFTPGPGSVALRADLDDTGRCMVSVTDTGIGISPNDMERALTVFGRACDSYVRLQEGSGLGLPICQRLAQIHDAKFAIESQVGHGTTVSVTFPKERVKLGG